MRRLPSLVCEDVWTWRCWCAVSSTMLTFFFCFILYINCFIITVSKQFDYCSSITFSECIDLWDCLIYFADIQFSSAYLFGKGWIHVRLSVLQDFFKALARVKQIHSDCKVLLRTNQQTAGWVGLASFCSLSLSQTVVQMLYFLLYPVLKGRCVVVLFFNTNTKELYYS